MRLVGFIALLAASACAGTLDDPERFDGLVPCEGTCGEGASGSGNGNGGSTGTVVPPAPTNDGTSGLPVGDVKLGSAVATARGCRTCHGDTLSGSPADMWTPNLTADVATGLGAWTDKQIVTAIRDGEGKDGKVLCGTMPTFPVNRIPDKDLADLLTYLRSLPATVGKAGVCE